MPSTLTKPAGDDKNFKSLEEVGVIHPSLMIKVGDHKFRMVVDTLSSCNYVGMELINKLKLKPSRHEVRTTETLYQKVQKRCPIYNLKICGLALAKHSLNIEAIGIDRKYITELTNPKIATILELQKPKFKNLLLPDERGLWPVDILLGQGDYSRIRKETPLVIGSGPTYPVVEDTHLGYILSQGATDSETASPGKSFFIASEATGEDQFEI